MLRFRAARRKMAHKDLDDITGLLAAWSSGSTEALQRLMDLVYSELRRIARGYLERRRPGESLESAGLANEAYLKLVRAGGIHCENRTHFLAVCSQIIRRILVDHARKRGFAKRGGKMARVPLDDLILVTEGRGIDLLALDEALERLTHIDSRKSRVVELRYFGGLTMEETADALGISVESAKRDWRMARAWLAGELQFKSS